MIKLIVGFIMGLVAMFLVMGILLIIKDEKQIKELKHKARER
jgi:ascorbate-specific PTS system EIIC-type component UlaA|tara:strand:+ start:346 stop:471 length:126 start_codon:yes stop_codon:yes gene_type:complete